MRLGPLAIALVAAAVLVTGAGVYLAFLPERSGTIAFWALSVGPTAALGVVAAAWAAREELLREWLSPRFGDFSRGVAGAVLLFMAGFAFCRVLAPVGSPREIWLVTLYGQIGNQVVLQAHGLEVGGAIVVASVAEELVWRGMVTQLLADALGTRTAWLWAAGLYALALAPTAWALRAGGGPLDPVLVLAALGGGLLWGAMARAFGRLGPSIVAHVLFDWAAIMMFRFWGPG